MEKGWKQIFMTVFDHQAAIARDILEEAGIKAVILNQHDSTYMSFGEYVVYVPDIDEERAVELLKDLKS